MNRFSRTVLSHFPSKNLICDGTPSNCHRIQVVAGIIAKIKNVAIHPFGRQSLGRLTHQIP